PFGHAGEAAIRDWFGQNRNKDWFADLSTKAMADFLFFDGNAQGHRILTKLEYHFLDGGMRLTYATIGAMAKYPRLSWHGVHSGIFSTEADLYRETADILGLPEKESGVWVRHPLSFLVEAADDICYAILDVEDAIELGILSFSDVRNLFILLCNQEVDVDQEFRDHQGNFRDFLSSIRGRAIQNLIEDIADVFTQKYEEILNGTLNKSLLESSKSDPVRGIRMAKHLGIERIYPDRRKTELEVGSYTTLSTLLDAFLPGVYSYRKTGVESYRAERIVRLMGKSKIDAAQGIAEAYHQVLDFVSGMTDNYATYLARQISGLTG
ncbi:MAG TPA: dNTP triphosphohydrolase, partial [Fibrobacteraceae bacterium]|nr:dNTP triphosphohydrolase [Fibrobacteraceae bacterium]